MARKQSTISSSIGLMLFGLPFLGVGLYMGWAIITTIHECNQMRSWVETPAQVISASLESHTSSGSNGSGSTTTYEVRARYSYVYDEKKYTSTRVSVHSGSDNIGSFHQETAARLKAARKAGRTVPCYVNPKRPSQAILIRTPRIEYLLFEAVFLLVFGGVGVGMIFVGLRGMFKQRKLSPEVAEPEADKPWLVRDEWRTGTIPSTRSDVAKYLGPFAFIWCVISFSIFFIALPDMRGDWGRIAGVAIMPLFGVALCCGALYFFLASRKYGTSVLQLTPTPGVLGGMLGGTVTIPKKLHADDGFMLTLSCIRRTRSGKETSERVLWSEEQLVTHDLAANDPMQTVLPVLFSVPYEQPETTIESGLPSVKWTLCVRAETEGIDYAATFVVPVFKTEASSPDFQLDASFRPEVVLGTSEEDFERHGVRVEGVSGGTRYTVLRRTRLGGMIVMGLVLGVWTGFLVGILYTKAPIIFPIAFGFFELLILFGFLQSVLQTHAFEVASDGILARGGMPGFTSEEFIPKDRIRSVDIQQGMVTGARQTCKLVVTDVDGKTHTLAALLMNRATAERLKSVVDKAYAFGNASHEQ